MLRPVRSLWIIAGLAVVAAAVLSFSVPRPKPAAPRTRDSQPAAPRPLRPPAAFRPDALASPLSGLPISRLGTSQRPIAVIVENHPAARPQWGLSQASRVYESLTEGPITRYLALFNGAQNAPRVGPVRSIRTQFLNYVAETGAALAHVGGNEDALAMIPTLHLANLDEFHFPGAYRRIFRPGLAYEHTMFTSIDALRDITDERGWGEEGAVPHPAWKDDAPASARPAAQIVTIDFSTPLYQVRWLYRSATDDYVRDLAGRPDVDALTGFVLRATTISIMVVHRVEGRTPIREDTWTYDDVGSGPAWVVEDGRVTPATWHKPWRAARLVFTDRNGAEIPMNRGPQWIEIVPTTVTPAFR
jgi:Protein of unknown function (DUF3048) N-terminal domain/Protein of unknown function (DUF3048) C-terminal domain